MVAGDKQVLKALHESEEKYRSLIDSMSEGFILGKPIRNEKGRPVDFVILETNPACEKLTGYRQDQLVGRRIAEIVPADEPAWLRHIGKVVSGGEPARFEEYNASIGKLLKIYAYPLHKEDLYAVIFSDITERKRTEEALRKSEAFLNNVFDCIQDGISVLDKDLNIVRTNNVMEEWYPYMMPLEGKKCYYVFHSRSMPCDICPSLRAIRHKAMQCSIVPFHDESAGIKGWQELFAFPLLDDDDNVTGVIEHVRDITERMRTEEALRKSEEKYRFLVENSKDVIWTMDLQGCWKFVSGNAEKLTGYKVDEILSGTLWDILAPEYHDAARDQLQRRMRGEDIPPHEITIIGKDGRRIPFELQVAPIFDEKGKVVGVQGVSRDISYRRQAEEALRSSEVKFRTLFENAGTAIVIVDHETGNVIDCNSNAEKLFGRPRDEITGMNVMQLHPPECREEHHRNIVRQAEQGRVVSYEVEILHKDGRKIPVIINATPVVIDGRKIMMGFFLDITERKRAEDSLRESEEKFRALTETVSAAICILQDGRFQYINPAMEAISGYTREELMSVDFKRLVHTDSLEYIKARYMSWLAGGSDEARGEFKGVDRNGMVRWADISRKTISYKGRPAILITGIDVTERKRVEKELLEAKSQAELYLDLMGHDINNMHQMALGYLEIARDAQADEGQKVLLDKPIEVLQRSARLIRNVRKLQRLREGTINVQTIDLCTQLSELQSEYGAVHDKTVSLNLNGHTGCYVLANELLYDVFANLVGNAIKHSERRASITISLDSRKEAGRLCYTVSVEDDGPGIPDDFKDCIFNRLLKGTTRANGSGIGLYLVKSLVDSYQGRVWVEDRVPDDYTKGAKFVVMLPAIEQ